MVIEENGPTADTEGNPSTEQESATKGAAETLDELRRNVEERMESMGRAAAAETSRRQEEADMADFKRQLRDVAAAKAAARTYTVQSGDTLSGIAQSQYGDAGRWPEIFEANKDKISNPNLIYPGQELSIP